MGMVLKPAWPTACMLAAEELMRIEEVLAARLEYSFAHLDRDGDRGMLQDKRTARVHRFHVAPEIGSVEEVPLGGKKWRSTGKR